MKDTHYLPHPQFQPFASFALKVFAPLLTLRLNGRPASPLAWEIG